MATAGQIGERVRRAREERGVSQTEVASRTGLDRASLSQIENGHSMPRTSTLLRIADALRIDVADLLSERGEKTYHHSEPSRPLPSQPVDSIPEAGMSGEPSGLHYAPLDEEHLHPGLEELLADERTRLMLGISPEEEEMLRSVRTRRDAPLGRDFFIDILIAYRRHQQGT
jgi:transcriptional regulator with XRE-family HTH domain